MTLLLGRPGCGKSPLLKALSGNLDKSLKLMTILRATFLLAPVIGSAIALSSMVLCEEALERELFISTSYVPGMEVTLSSRLKSLYSIYSKVWPASSLEEVQNLVKTWEMEIKDNRN